MCFRDLCVSDRQVKLFKKAYDLSVYVWYCSAECFSVQSVSGMSSRTFLVMISPIVTAIMSVPNYYTSGDGQKYRSSNLINYCNLHAPVRINKKRYK